MRDWLGRWPFTGREAELDAFAAALADPTCRGFVVGGAAGVGKSRLAEECLERAAAAGLRVGQATASAAAGAVPLGAIAHLLPAGVHRSDPVAAFASVAAELDAGPGRRWVLLVDDVHLLDAASAVLLRQLMDSGAILLIATVRSGEPHGDAVAALRGGDAVYRVTLDVLGPDRIGALLHAVLGGPVARRTVHELAAASAGNVLYLRELALGALAAGELTEDGEIWHLVGRRLPGTALLTELVGTRLAAAESGARPVLELLALCEPLPLADAEVLAPPRVMTDLERSGLIRVTQDRRRTMVQLAHPLYGEILRAGLPVLRRRALLLEQAARVEAHGARRRGDPLHIAGWRLTATGTADPELLTRAAALARHAHDYARTTALLRAVPKRHRTRVIDLRLGEALFEMGRWDEAETVLANADREIRADHARAHCDEQDVLSDEQGVLDVVLARTANLLWSNAPVAEALAVNTAALDRISTPAGRRRLRINEGFLRIAADRPPRGLALLADLESEVGDASDLGTWLRGAWMKAAGLAVVGRTREATSWAEHAYTAHRRIDEHVLASHPAIERIPLVLALTEAGLPAEARLEGERAYAELVAADSVVRVWLAVLLGRTEWLAGHPATARRWWAEAASLARGIDHAMALRLVLAGLAACAAVVGDLDAARAALAEHGDLPSLTPGFLSAGEERLGEAWLLAASGNLARARTVLLAAADSARTTGHLASEGLLLTDLARLGGAPEAADRLTALSRTCDGELAAVRAEFAAALAADDPDRLGRAADACETVGADLLTAEAATAAAAAWHRADRPRRAAAHGRRAMAAAARCEGARTPLLTAAGTVAVLTAREREIALCAAAGQTSKDIAQALTLSVRTVDNHLHRVYTKLGITTRRELARALTTAAE
ncbi:LuxR C-terminal-related transcriptional regulator [Streptomyces sp. CA-249302]|uniref:helix-turn-helix transcriptional regulator n=1 Tax=Streptomyces sp. CA-249302 TaxID=3240058 RepID=UPI003D91A50C